MPAMPIFLRCTTAAKEGRVILARAVTVVGAYIVSPRCSIAVCHSAIHSRFSNNSSIR
jgi:hypothetical protein